MSHELQDASGYTGYTDQDFTPATESELLEILRNATRDRIPITISGGLTGLTGGAIPQGGWSVSMERFQRLEISPGRAIAGAGVSLDALQAAASPTGQFYAPDPTETTASVGGTIVNNASGSRSFRYGATRRHVLGLRVAFMDGTVREFHRGDRVDFPVAEIPLSCTTKNTAGYLLQPEMEWIDLLAPSEGTLAVVIEAELQLLPKPKDVLAGVIFLENDDAALDAVRAWHHLRGLRMIEYFDRNSLLFLRERFPEVPGNAGVALLIEQEEGDIDYWVDHAPEDSWFADNDKDRERFRKFRHALPELVNDTVRRRGFLKLNSDYAVPLHRNREMLAAYHGRLRSAGLDYVIFGHIGDAHVHVNILPKSQAEFDTGQELMLEFARQAVAFGGTVSAEHGLGKRKAKLLAIQYTPDQIEAMKNVKRHLDPNWLLSPGTLFG
ncbi:MAG TPA: FAD-binding oxidoreductase [Bryobacteraceae bacterium]|nr:FAD-binding oxidoreductase [Bryobacteraceae bacterium]